eukprot:m.21521 g.21521  ORF g.21521 m.21521 type:complete len:336 (-) comp3931_c1_seq1:65-1072(-)
MAGAVGECSVCLDDAVLRPTGCAAGHVFCDACQAAAYSTSIAEQRLPLHCLACDDEVDVEAARAVLSSTVFQRFLELSLLAHLRRERALLCPHPDCEYAAFVDGADFSRCPEVVCPQCDKSICAKCNEEWHTGRCKTGQQHQGVKPCPQCGAGIFKLQDGSCNHMTCALCRAEFCWLCGKVLDSWTILNHFGSFSGCTFFGSRQWSQRKINAYRLSAPVTVPLAIAGGAVGTALATLCLPPMVASDTWRNSKGGKVSRALKAGSMGLFTVLMVPTAGAVTVAGFGLRGLVYAYMQMPARQASSLVQRVAKRAQSGQGGRVEADPSSPTSPDSSQA